jgi:hypothetical protein
MYENNQKRDLMEDPKKGVDQAISPLAKLWRLTLRELQVNPWRWKQLMEQHVRDPRSGIPQTPSDRASERGNLNKELRKPKLTWGVFFRGIRLLNPVRARIELHLTWPNQKVTVHGLDIIGRPAHSDNPQDITAMVDEFDHMLRTDRTDPALPPPE